MKTVWKTSVPVDDEWHYVHGKIVHAEPQFEPDTVEVWFETPTDHFITSCEVRVYGTGHMVPDDAEHVGSWVSPELVWHAYARTPEEPA